MRHIIAAARAWITWYLPITRGAAETLAADKVALASAGLVHELAQIHEYFHILGIDAEAVEAPEARPELQVVR